MKAKYPNLLSPLKVGNTYLRNRLVCTPNSPHFVQGGESYPTNAYIVNATNHAKSGAALVTCRFSTDDNYKAGESKEYNPRSMQGHFPCFDFFDSHSQHYLSQLTEGIHMYGAKAMVEIFPPTWSEYDISSGIPSLAVPGDASISTVGEEMSVERLKLIADTMAKQCKAIKAVGFDGVFVHMSYKATYLGRALSNITNKRMDEFGGCLENRCRFPFMVCDRIKEVCGKDFLIEASISAYDPLPDGWTIEDSIGFSKLAEGHIDIIQLRANEIDPAHPTGFNSEKHPFLKWSEQIKKGGSKVPITTVGGYLDIDDSEEIIASGKADLIGMARAWISNPDYGKKVFEGRSEDVVPCLRCNKCHKSSYNDVWTSVCSVNPVWGLEYQIERLEKESFIKRKVAVVGGGPAGMEAALTAAKRGHEVTLYEKTDKLGGLLNTADNVPFKWPLRDFKNYLVYQILKSAVNVILNTAPTEDMLKSENYDAVLIAVGSDPIIPTIKGINGKNVITAVDVYKNEEKLAKDVVVIGGGEIGVETGMHLAKLGHKIKLIEMLDILAPEATPIHYYSMFLEAVHKTEGFEYILGAKCTEIMENGVKYIDKSGKEKFIEAGSVVVAVGMKSKIDEALVLCSADYNSKLIGDCNKVGNVQKVMRSAYTAVYQI